MKNKKNIDKVKKDKNFKNKLTIFFKKKSNIAVVLIISIAILILLVYLIFFINNENKKKFALSSIYDVYPEEVRELYANLVSVSCKGDLYLPIELDEETATLVVDLNKTTLLDYVFSYLDKNDLLDEGKIKKNVFNATINKLIADNLEYDLIDYVDEYVYGNYIYTYDEDEKIIKRESSEECVGDKDYFSQLYGYSYTKKTLSMDINIGYIDDGDLYNLKGEKLGEFKNVFNAQKLFKTNSYYRYNYIKENGEYKLKSVRWMSRT